MRTQFTLKLAIIFAPAYSLLTLKLKITSIMETFGSWWQEEAFQALKKPEWEYL